MGEKDLVSIVVAIYKSELFLDKLIQSIINQTYSNLEIILVDDGSPDKSGDICDSYQKKDDRIKVIHKKNGGCCDARNKGLEIASGEWLMIIDGDDWLAPDYVEYLLDLAIKNDADMAFSYNIFTTRDQKQIDYEDKIEVISGEKAAGIIIYPYMAIGPWNKIYKMSLIRDNNISFSVPWSGEGLYFASTAAQYSKKVATGRRKVYNYRLNNVNSGLTNYNVEMGINAIWNIKNIKNNLIINSKYLQHACDWHIWKNYKFLLSLIIATNSKSKYLKEYRECKRKRLTMLFSVIIHSDVSFKTKIKMLFSPFFMVTRIKRKIKKNQKELKKDIFE